MSLEKTVIMLMLDAAPERSDEIKTLWATYHPKVILAPDTKKITLNASKDRIEFDTKTIEVFWLIGFSGWKAIECYSPHVICSAASGQTVETLIQEDRGLDEVERAYKERLAVAKDLISAADTKAVQWPPDLPHPNSSRNATSDKQYQAAFDLTCLAVAFTLFHEFRHVMLDFDKVRPNDRREEELACDVWAREFMTAKLAKYARDHRHRYDRVLRKRSMGLALAALILHEITPFWDHGGNAEYFSVATRLEAILQKTPLPETDEFWIFTASIMIGTYRQHGKKFDAPSMEPKNLTQHLIDNF